MRGKKAKWLRRECKKIWSEHWRSLIQSYKNYREFYQKSKNALKAKMV